MTEHTSRDLSALYIPGAIVLAGLIIGVSLVLALKPTGGVGTATGGQLVAVDIQDVEIDDRPYIGAENAPVVLAYWADHMCGFCAQFETQTLPLIVTEYVDTGKVRVVFKHYAFLSPDSELAALYEEAIWELYPARHLEWRAATYRALGEGSGEAHLMSVTRSLTGIDADRVRTLVEQKRDEYLARLADDRAEGAAFGIDGTPGFITGTTLIPGAASIAEFKKAIDEQL